MSGLHMLSLNPAVAWGAVGVFAQVTVIVAVASLLARYVRRWGAAARHTVWFTALVCILLSPVIAIVMPGVVSIPVAASRPVASTSHAIPTDQTALPETPATEATGARVADRVPADGSPQRSATQIDVWRTAAAGAAIVWLAGVLLLAVGTLRGLCSLHRLRRDARPLDDERWTPVLARALRRLETQRAFDVASSQLVPTPLAVGLWRPVVLLPQRLLSTLRDSELEDVLVHECAHLVRRDLFVGLLQRLAALLFWPHPLVHVLNRRLSQAREEVCDNYVLRNGDARRYAGTLLSVAEHLTTVAAWGIGLLPAHWRLEDRVTGLLDVGRRVSTRTRNGLKSVLALSLLGVVTAVAGLRVADNAVHADDLDEPDNELTLTAHFSKRDYKPTDEVRLYFTITNTGRRALFIGDGFPAPQRHETAPGRHFEISATVDQGAGPLEFSSTGLTRGPTVGIRKVFALKPGATYRGSIVLYSPEQILRGGGFRDVARGFRHIPGRHGSTYRVQLSYQVNPETHVVWKPPAYFDADRLWTGTIATRPLEFRMEPPRRENGQPPVSGGGFF